MKVHKISMVDHELAAQLRDQQEKFDAYRENLLTPEAIAKLDKVERKYEEDFIGKFEEDIIG